jgi:hypothetical protein
MNRHKIVVEVPYEHRLEWDKILRENISSKLSKKGMLFPDFVVSDEYIPKNEIKEGMHRFSIYFDNSPIPIFTQPEMTASEAFRYISDLTEKIKMERNEKELPDIGIITLHKYVGTYACGKKNIQYTILSK